MNLSDIKTILGSEADSLLSHQCQTILKDRLHLPGPDQVQDVFSQSDRSSKVQKNLLALYNNGRLGGTGYLSILPVDQGIEHSAGASFAKNPD